MPRDPGRLNDRYRPEKHVTAGELRALGAGGDIPGDVPDSAWLPLSSKGGRGEEGPRFWSFVRPYEWRK